MRPMANELSLSQSEHGGTKLGTGSPNVLVHGGKAWRAIRDEFDCPHHGPEKMPIGHTRVLVNNFQAGRVGDFLLGAGAPDQVIGVNRVMLGEEPVGLESADGMKAWCTEWCTFEKNWPDLTEEQRREQYTEMVGRMFAGFGASAPEVVFEPDIGGYINVVNGNFGVGSQYFSKPTASADLRRVTYHETRHGEQLFMGIRYARHQAQLGNPLTGDNTGDKNSALVAAADAMGGFTPNSPEEAFAQTMAHGYSRDVGLDQLGWANEDYGHRYQQIPGGADANRIDGDANTKCAC
jgi:uncharacterized Zn-binding protein involved in type VI secretion